MSVLRFPARHAAVFLVSEPLGGVYVIFGNHGLLFGSAADAVKEARRIAAAHGLPVRETSR